MKKDICVLSLILCVTAVAPLLAGCGDGNRYYDKSVARFFVRFKRAGG